MVEPTPTIAAAWAIIRAQADTTEATTELLRLLAGDLDPRSRRKVELAAREIEGAAQDRPGRPAIDDAPALERITAALARGVSPSVAVATEARGLANRGGGAAESIARRLRRKLA